MSKLSSLVNRINNNTEATEATNKGRSSKMITMQESAKRISSILAEVPMSLASLAQATNMTQAQTALGVVQLKESGKIICLPQAKYREATAKEQKAFASKSKVVQTVKTKKALVQAVQNKSNKKEGPKKVVQNKKKVVQKKRKANGARKLEDQGIRHIKGEAIQTKKVAKLVQKKREDLTRIEEKRGVKVFNTLASSNINSKGLMVPRTLLAEVKAEAGELVAFITDGKRFKFALVQNKEKAIRKYGEDTCFGTVQPNMRVWVSPRFVRDIIEAGQTMSYRLTGKRDGQIVIS